MAATPKYGAMQFFGLLSKKTYSKDIYISDVNAGLINWDGGSGASAASPTSISFPEPVLLTDFSMITGTADTEKIQLTRNNMGVGDILRYSIHLTTLNNRPKLAIGFAAKDEIRAIQISD